ncbi:predicted protein [Sclerotinia sclerotiorum 1980 UF-70]|uniref:Uncharacterized protein n=1 Tax=Sclerotinia sclerotiorum (strain ATCC 18683 / 1980 / Ss-1) TaxID=665079 RepID=A7ECV0_SCLS1|nr:predicted protein [Sclerotinia sclerotiorum 1980 UF-70]EDO00666.1 predicted protein [Sclerotinia sclerotiorum 1980 UF-70]
MTRFAGRGLETANLIGVDLLRELWTDLDEPAGSQPLILSEFRLCACLLNGVVSGLGKALWSCPCGVTKNPSGEAVLELCKLMVSESSEVL